MDTSRLSTVAGNYYALRGLLLVPCGLLFIAAGLTNLPLSDSQDVTGNTTYFYGALVVAGISYFLLSRYYARQFGRVDPSTRTKVRVWGFSAIIGVGVAIGITVDSRFDLPISTFGVLFGVCWLLYYAKVVGLRPYHWVVYGGLIVLSMLPVWGDVDNKASVVMVPIGVATMIIGVFDHLELVKSIRELQFTGIAGEVNAHTV